jgi:ABC-type transport system involved in multi-copper enzyme maturation permease subunit
MLKALVWKDLRINRLPLFMGTFLLVVPYIIVGVAVRGMPLWQEATAASAWAVLLATGCHFSVMCSQPTLAILSGHLIAVERGDRSAEFLSYLPPSRSLILLSKALVLAVTILIVWGLNLVIQSFAYWLSAESVAAYDLTSHLASLPRFAGIGFLAAGAGWCASANLENSGPAVALGLAAPAALFGGLMTAHSGFNVPNELAFSNTYFALCPILSVVFFATGTWSYLRRVEP